MVTTTIRKTGCGMLPWVALLLSLPCSDGFSTKFPTTTTVGPRTTHPDKTGKTDNGSFALSGTQLFMAKTTSKKNKKKAKGGSGGGLKGFGGAGGSGGSGAAAGVEIDRSKTARSFYDFLEQGNAGDNLSRCALGYFPLGDDVKLRGVVSRKPLKKGDNIIRIPYELAVNLGPEGADPSVPALEFLRQYCQIMSVSDEKEAGAADQRRAYFEMLPPYRGDDCLGSTDFFSEEALQALQAPLVEEETLQRRAQTKNRFEREVDHSFPKWIDGTPVTADHLQWAVWLITSRVLTVQGSEEEGQSYRLLIPFLDMCNHDRSSAHVLTGRAVPGGELKVLAGAAVKEGTQINICYGGGMAGNDRFLQDYGFLDTSGDSKAYTMVAQGLVGRRRVMEGAGAGRLMSEPDRERSLDKLQETTREQDRALLESTTDSQVRAALTFRLGVKEALSEFITMP